MKLPPWSDLRVGVGCPLCSPRPAITEFAYLVGALSVSSLYVIRDQTYRGTCAVIYDLGHATRPSELTAESWSRFTTDARAAEEAVSAIFRPDHVNLECLGNTVPHLHLGIIPRYRSDPRWGHPIWTTSRDERIRTPVSDEECETIAKAVRQSLRGAG